MAKISKAKNEDNLTERQEKFADVYAYTHNGMRAAKEAGYAPTTVHTVARQLLSLEHVREAIKKKRAAINERMFLDEEWFCMKLVWAMKKCAKHKPFMSGGYLKAMELLGKHLGYLSNEKEGNEALKNNILDILVSDREQNKRKLINAEVAEIIEVKSE